MREEMRHGKHMTATPDNEKGPETAEIRLAIYDMDRTVTRLPTYTPFLIHAAARRNPLRLLTLPLVGVFSLAYTLKLIDRTRLKEMMQWMLLGAAINPQRLVSVVDSFADKTFQFNVRPGALESLKKNKAEGYRLVLATASYRLYVEAIAQRFGFDDVIATNSLIGLDKRIIARIDGENCYGPGKMRMVEAWMKREELAREDCHVRFYSDHISDAPLLAWADEGFAVNAHKALRKLAQNMKWGVVDW
jgi:HAD superfamily hydrolase (TIGR01490 family)